MNKTLLWIMLQWTHRHRCLSEILISIILEIHMWDLVMSKLFKTVSRYNCLTHFICFPYFKEHCSSLPDVRCLVNFYPKYYAFYLSSFVLSEGINLISVASHWLEMKVLFFKILFVFMDMFYSYIAVVTS